MLSIFKLSLQVCLILAFCIAQGTLSAQVTLHRDTIWKSRPLESLQALSINRVLAYHDSVVIVTNEAFGDLSNHVFFSRDRGQSFDSLALPGNALLPSGPTIGVELVGIATPDSASHMLWRQRGHSFEMLDSIPIDLPVESHSIRVHPYRAHMLIAVKNTVGSSGDPGGEAWMWRDENRTWRSLHIAQWGGAVDFRFDYLKTERIYSLNTVEDHLHGSTDTYHSYSDDYGNSYTPARGVEGVGMILPGHAIVNNDSMQFVDSSGQYVDLHIRENIIQSLYPNESPSNSPLTTDLGKNLDGVVGHSQDPSTFAVRVKRDSVIQNSHLFVYGWVLTRDTGSTWQWLAELAQSRNSKAIQVSFDPITGDVYYSYGIVSPGNWYDEMGVVRVMGSKPTSIELSDESNNASNDASNNESGTTSDDPRPLSIAPNPTTGHLTIALSVGLVVDDVRLVDMMGSMSTNASIVRNSGAYDLDLSALSNGQYFVIVQTQRGCRTGRVVLNR